MFGAQAKSIVIKRKTVGLITETFMFGPEAKSIVIKQKTFVFK